MWLSLPLSVLRGSSGQTGSSARCPRSSERSKRRAQGEAAARCRGGRETETDPTRPETGDHEAEEAGELII